MQETERNKTSELAKSRRNAYHKRRSGQVSESLEFPHDDGSNPGTSNLSGYPVFKGVNDMNESLTSSGSLNDVDNDSSITVNRYSFILFFFHFSLFSLFSFFSSSIFQKMEKKYRSFGKTMLILNNAKKFLSK